ncbi:Gustatory receptor 77 [Frankliniella occidentalis]|nr:Gustatory receptor 77 [Frankliniella occidentalis]
MDVLPAAEHKRPSPPSPPAPPGWARHWARQWRAMLALLSASGMNCTSGWPPRPSPVLRWYGCLVLAVRTFHNVQAILELKASHEDAGKIDYNMLLILYDMGVKLVTSVVSQVVLLVRCEDVCLSTECMLLYSRVGRPPVPGAMAVAIVGPAYMIGLVVMTAASTYVLSASLTHMLSHVLGDFAPTTAMIFVGIMQLLITALHVGLATDGSSHVRGWQFLHDMVLHHNSALGWCYLSCLAHVLMEAVVCLYLGASHLRLLAAEVGYVQPNPLLNPWLYVWGVFELTVFCGMCVLGQKLSDHHGRMYCVLRGFLVSNPQLCTKTKLELQGFAQQIRRQDNRPGIFGLIHYDLATMKAGFASTVTYIIVLSQFEPTVGH